ncbi:MAG TPA: hypothetical protein VMF89_01425 [Polyangiales bacterium]|nr:hypothetical protein [Polyangiales bacterium]
MSFAVWLCALACSTVLSARAQDHDKAAAEALFDEGRKLMAAGDYAAACPKLAASQALDAGVGTSFNLADCYEKLGKTASAWALFRETAAAARNAGSPERERVARSRADALASQLAHLTILAPAEAETLQITRDGTRIDAAAIGSALPVDPGDYTIAASAPGKLPWSTIVRVPAASRVSLNVPLLEDEPRVAEQNANELRAIEPQLTAATPAPSNTQKLIGIIASGTGVAALAVGGYFGLRAASTWSDAKSGCDPYPYCGEEGQRLANDAQQSGTAATIATVAGSVLLAGGLVLWLTAPGPAGDTETALLVGPASVQLRGTFQ